MRIILLSHTYFCNCLTEEIGQINISVILIFLITARNRTLNSELLKEMLMNFYGHLDATSEYLQKSKSEFVICRDKLFK
jgi:hypothetical protein